MKLLFIILFSFFMFSSALIACESDYQCESLCCDKEAQTCKAHDPARGLFCNKEAGQLCVISELCAASYGRVCKIIKTGTDASGNMTCRLTCSVSALPSQCIENFCVPAVNPPMPDYNPNDCSNAVDP